MVHCYAPSIHADMHTLKTWLALTVPIHSLSSSFGDREHEPLESEMGDVRRE
jgi:hypothetical protein